MRLLAAAFALVTALLWPLAASAQDPYFEVDRIIPPLSDAPSDLMRDTPQATVEAFLDFGREDDWQSAAHLLALPDGMEHDPETLAYQLYAVLNRKTMIDWSRLMDRPDGMDAMASSDSAVAGEPRRSILLALIDLDDHPVSIRLNRLKAPDADPVWLFAPQSIANVPALFQRYGPNRFERALPDPLRDVAFWGLRWWETVALPLLIFAAFAVGRIVYRLLSVDQAKIAGMRMGKIIRAARAPAVIAAVTTLIGLAARHVFVFSGVIDLVLTPLLTTGYVIAVLWLLVSVVDALLDRLVSFEGADLTEVGEGSDARRQMATNIAAARRLVIVVVALVGFGIVLSQANVLRTMGFSLLASAGAITIILAYAARNVLSNIMSSLQIAMNKSARIGDKVLYDGHICSVERINFTYVQLRVWTGERLVVPVNDFVDTVFENWTMQDPYLIRTVRLKFAHDVDVDILREIYEEALAEVEDKLSNAQEDDRGVVVSDQDVFGKEVLFEVPCDEPNTAWMTACEVRERIITKAIKRGKDEGWQVFPNVSPAEAV